VAQNLVTGNKLLSAFLVTFNARQVTCLMSSLVSVACGKMFQLNRLMLRLKVLTMCLVLRSSCEDELSEIGVFARDQPESIFTKASLRRKNACIHVIRNSF